ncbi:TPA: RtcB family protein, partial [Escherichia coli]
KTLHSLAHGAGRKWGRTECKGRLAAKYTATRYIAEHDDALAFARINRQMIALRIMQQVKATGSPVLDVAHNFVSACQIGDQQGWLHRKGATPDDNGLVIIPGSRGDYSWLVKPVAN